MFIMSNPKRKSKYFVPDHIGTQPRGFGGNKGKQMQDKSGEACSSNSNQR